MFISQLNKAFRFSEKKWLISIADKSMQTSSGATILIEGVLARKLLFACYDLTTKALPSNQTKETGYTAYISHIDCFESDRYKLPFPKIDMLSYSATPIACDRLGQHLREIALIPSQQIIIENKSLPKEILIPTSCTHWCFDCLRHFGILTHTVRPTPYS